MGAGTSAAPEPGNRPPLTPEVVEAICAAVSPGPAARPDSGNETGGFLTSSTARGAVDGAHCVSCEHRFGPRYRLSEKDRRAFRAAVQRVEGPVRVVGLFRSDSRESPAPRPEDVELARELVPGCRLLVVATPLRNGCCRLRAFRPDPINGEFSIGEEVEASLAPQRAGGSGEAVVARAGPLERETARRQGGSWRHWKITAVVVTFLVVAGLAGVGLRSLRWPALIWKEPEPGVENAGELGLSAEMQGTRLHVIWNRQAPAIRQARAGKLVIRDGGSIRELQLSQAEITSGFVIYPPVSNDVLFELQVLGPGRPSLESLRVIDPLRSETSPAPVVELPSQQVQRPTSSATADREVEKRSPVATVGPGSELNQPKVATRNRFVPPNPPPRSIPAVPDLAPPSGASILIEAQHPAALSTVAPVAAQVQIPPQPRPLRSSERPPALVVTPPKPIRQVVPNLRALGIPSVYASVDVPIAVRVDVRGRVVSAQPEKYDPNISRSLVAAAVAAAKQWTFQPASSGGNPVPSSHTIVFHFAPPG
jgi:hypothetical protein